MFQYVKFTLWFEYPEMVTLAVLNACKRRVIVSESGKGAMGGLLSYGEVLLDHCGSWITERADGETKTRNKEKQVEDSNDNNVFSKVKHDGNVFSPSISPGHLAVHAVQTDVFGTVWETD